MWVKPISPHTHFGDTRRYKSSAGVTLSPWRRLKLTLPNLYPNTRQSRRAARHTHKYAPGEMKIISAHRVNRPALVSTHTHTHCDRLICFSCKAEDNKGRQTNVRFIWAAGVAF